MDARYTHQHKPIVTEQNAPSLGLRIESENIGTTVYEIYLALTTPTTIGNWVEKLYSQSYFPQNFAHGRMY